MRSGVPDEVDVDPEEACDDLCGRTTQSQQDCLADAECNDLSDGDACGVPLIRGRRDG